MTPWTAVEVTGTAAGLAAAGFGTTTAAGLPASTSDIYVFGVQRANWKKHIGTIYC
jgi:hypothetical protein